MTLDGGSQLLVMLSQLYFCFFLKRCCILHEACHTFPPNPNLLFSRLSRQTRTQLYNVLRRPPLKLNPLDITDLERSKLSLFPFTVADSAANQPNLVSMRSKYNRRELLIFLSYREMKSVQAP